MAVGPVTPQCPSCHAPLAGSPKFCPECGTALAAAPVRETRRTVTLLFTDVTGSTAMGEALDPEAYRGVMGRYFEVAREAVERHGGTLEKFVGDAVLAVFGMPEIREDDAIRAVRAAADLRAGIADLGAELERTHGVRLVIRTGVNTGPVVTGSARAGGAFATGDAVNTAARLEQAAAPGEILLGEATYRLARDVVEAEPTAPLTAKGKAAPLPAYRLLSVRSDEQGRHRPDLPMVGREQESRALADILERVLTSHRSHLVTVVGAPGAGKTRLVTEFLAEVGGRAVVAGGRCVSYGHGITYWPVVQALRAALGVGGTEPDEVTHKAVVDAMSGAEDATSVADLLLPLLGGAGAPGSREQTFWAVRRLLEEIARRGPLVLTVDDLHWAEPTLLDLLDAVRDELADLPVLLLCQARPELFANRPEWGRGALNALTFQLEPLRSEDVGRSVAALLGDDVPDPVTQAVARWSGGNPLFVEEIVAHLRETGRLQRDGEGWHAEALDRLEMPPSVSALLAARLDRLPPTERDLLQRISVIGLEVTAAEAAVLAEQGADVPTGLAALARAELLNRVRSADGERWAFRHILIRDAAYDALPKALRAELHERFADSLEHTPSDAGAERLAFVAHHLEQAGRLRHELAPHDPRLADLDRRTAATLAAAADAAADRDDMHTSSELLERACALPLDAASRRALIIRLADGAIGETGDVPDRLRKLDLFEALLDETTTEVDHAFLACERMHLLLESSDPTGDVDEAARLAQRLLDVSGEDRVAATVAHKCLASVSTMRSRWRDVLVHVDALAALGSHRAVRIAALARGGVYANGPFPYSRLLEFSEEQLARPELTPTHRGTMLLGKANALAALGRPEWGAVATEAERLLASSPGVPFFVDSLRGELAYCAGRPHEAITHYGRVVARASEEGQDSYASTYQGWRICLALHTHQHETEVMSWLAQAEAWAEEYDVTTMTVVHAARGVLASRAGDHDEALRRAGAALAHAESSDALRHRADARTWLAEVWRRAGDPAEERRQLEQAVAEYRQKEAVVLAARAEKLLEASGD